jgi:hypothetical protein
MEVAPARSKHRTQDKALEIRQRIERLQDFRPQVADGIAFGTHIRLELGLLVHVEVVDFSVDFQRLEIVALTNGAPEVQCLQCLVECGDVRFGVAADGQTESAQTVARDVADGFKEAHVCCDVVWVSTERLAGFEPEDVVGEEVGASFSADIVVEVAQEFEDLERCAAIICMLVAGSLESLCGYGVFDCDWVWVAEKERVDDIADFSL